MWIKNELTNSEGIWLDLNYLVNSSNQFYNLCLKRTEEEKAILNLFEARMNLESCLTFLKEIIEVHENKLIQKINESHPILDLMDNYYENLFAILDLEEQKLRDYLTESKKLFNPFLITVSIKSFKERLLGYMSDLVLFPLLNAVTKYKNIINFTEERKVVFEYILFREVYISAKIKGSQARQKLAMASHTLGARFSETNIIKSGKKSLTPEQQDQLNFIPPKIEDQFSDMFEPDEMEEIGESDV